MAEETLIFLAQVRTLKKFKYSLTHYIIVTTICILWQSSIMVGKKAVKLLFILTGPMVKTILNHSRGLDKQKFQRKIVNIFLPKF